MIALRAVTKRYGGRTAVEDLSFEVWPGVVTGLDPAGIEWMRRLLERLAAEGRTVLVASHHLAEMQAIAGALVVIAKGRLLADTTVAELTGGGAVSLSDAFLTLTGAQPNDDPARGGAVTPRPTERTRR